MTPSAELSGLPLPAFGRPAPEDVAHPALAAVLAEREASGEPVVAYYEDAP